MLKKCACALSLAAGLLRAVPAFALDEVYSTEVVKGEVETEYSGSRTFDSDRAKNNIQSHELELEYGLTDHFKVKTSLIFDKDVNESTKLNEVEVGGIYRFFEPGEWWLDPALLVNYGRSVRTSGPDAIEVKLLLEKQWGRFTHLANLGVEREAGNNATPGLERSFLWSSRYRYDAHFEPGVEIQSDFGKVRDRLHFNEQEHYIGPAVYGEIIPNVNYQAAYEFGVTSASATGAARLKIEFEKAF